MLRAKSSSITIFDAKLRFALFALLRSAIFKFSKFVLFYIILNYYQFELEKVLQSQIKSGGWTQQAKYEQSRKTLNSIDGGQLAEKLQTIPLFHVAGTKVSQF